MNKKNVTPEHIMVAKGLGKQFFISQSQSWPVLTKTPGSGSEKNTRIWIRKKHQDPDLMSKKTGLDPTNTLGFGFNKHRIRSRGRANKPRVASLQSTPDCWGT